MKVVKAMLVLVLILSAALVALALQSPRKDTASGAMADARPADARIPPPPRTKVEVVEETMHGRKIADPYRWLENAESAETRAFVEEQAAYTNSLLGKVPWRGKIEARLKELMTIGVVNTPQIGGAYYFYTRREGMQNQPVLYVREGVRGKDRVLVDVNELAADGTIALDWYQASDDGKRVAYWTSPSGSEHSTIKFIESATGTILQDEIYVGRGRSLAWLPDGSGFYYQRFPKKGTVPEGQEVYNPRIFFHKLGTDPEKDPLIYGEGLHPQHWPGVGISEDGRWLLINVFQSWTKNELFIQDLEAKSAPVPVASGKEAIYFGEVFQGDIYMVTNDEAPRYRVFRVPAANPGRENWKEIIPQTDAVLNNAQVIGGKLVAQYEKNASSQLRVFELDGRPAGEIKLPTIGSITQVGGRWNSKEAFYDFTSYTVPPSVYRYEIKSAKSELWEKVSAAIDAAAYDVKQVWYASKDGTKVPMFIVSKKSLQRTGKTPTVLYGYGGFNVSLTPTFKRSMFLWLENGGIYAEANLRGGAEFGEDWHRAGMRDKKQNVFDDYIAAAEYLIREKYTDTAHLAIYGGSNGGLLVGAAMTQRPGLFKAVVCAVPLLDMLRFHHFQIAKLWIPEYGDPDKPEEFNWLYAYSPYHHVRKGTKYPATLFVTADTDTRVDPMHAKKMTALMQAASGGDNPILLRIETKAGHGQGKPISKQIEEATDVFTFLFWQLGLGDECFAECKLP
jgi:prolyl oligopeptidase